ncbi:uncharacterized protein LOC118507520 [Anopheles stephensi]|uniref:uncharacterized protein LOC118507520 n=1 Tax=Anopheles stephensi TaxID=30069 RepID=UPI0016588855|nr:uncharacterized protein LOC118507520 [Anopheles stephensi]XP_035901974.1 uncharacterized protein LOC118507520 [Anopheles stephensi]
MLLYRIAMCCNVERDNLSKEREVIDRWKCYFNRHLNGADTGDIGPDEGSRRELHYNSQHDNDEVLPPSLDENISAIRLQKTHISAGSDGLVAKVFKLGPKRLAAVMHGLIVTIWDQEELPDEWKLGVIHPVYKKGDSYSSVDFLSLLQISSEASTFRKLDFLETNS